MPAGRDYAYFNVSRETLASVITPGVESYLFVQADVTEKMTLLIRSGKIPTLEVSQQSSFMRPGRVRPANTLGDTSNLTLFHL
jgi:hypothetical protein